MSIKARLGMFFRGVVGAVRRLAVTIIDRVGPGRPIYFLYTEDDALEDYLYLLRNDPEAAKRLGPPPGEFFSQRERGTQTKDSRKD